VTAERESKHVCVCVGDDKMLVVTGIREDFQSKKPRLFEFFVNYPKRRGKRVGISQNQKKNDER
jgi:hypothetical protein